MSCDYQNRLPLHFVQVNYSTSLISQFCQLVSLGVGATLALMLTVGQVGCKSDATCRANEGCAKHGLCHSTWRSCVAETSADCKQSQDCEYAQSCTLVNGVCKTTDIDCQEAKDCRIHGACKAAHPLCIVGSEEDCRRSGGCRQWGACGMWIDYVDELGSKHAQCAHERT